MFRADELPYYSSHAGLVELGKRALRLRQRLRRALQKAAPPPAAKPDSGETGS